MTIKRSLQWALCATVVLLSGCGNQAGTGQGGSTVSSEVTERGSIEVVAELQEIPDGAIFERDLYNYATVLKYIVKEVRRGKISTETIYVAHYNPFKPRAEAADRKAPEIGGDLHAFESGQIHHMALEAPIDDFYMGGIVNKYFGEKIDTIYWAVWTSSIAK